MTRAIYLSTILIYHFSYIYGPECTQLTMEETEKPTLFRKECDYPTQGWDPEERTPLGVGVNDIDQLRAEQNGIPILLSYRDGAMARKYTASISSYLACDHCNCSGIYDTGSRFQHQRRSVRPWDVGGPSNPRSTSNSSRNFRQQEDGRAHVSRGSSRISSE